MKLSNVLATISEWDFVLLLSLIALMLMIPVLYYVHEGGHVLFGTLSNILKFNTFYVPKISNWIYIWGIPLPQQTVNAEGMGTLLFVLGGILSTAMFGLALSFILAKFLKKVPKDRTYLLFAGLVIFEIVFNFVLGTDNPSSAPIVQVNQELGTAGLAIVAVAALSLPLIVIIHPYREVLVGFTRTLHSWRSNRK
jgi:hypothetical protein